MIQRSVDVVGSSDLIGCWFNSQQTLVRSVHLDALLRGRMGGRQSVQTDLHRRPRSNSAAEPAVVAASTANRNTRSITGIGSTSNLRGRLGNESASESDEDAPGTSAVLPPQLTPSATDARHAPLRFAIPHLRTHRMTPGPRDSARRSMPVLQLLGRLAQDIECPVCRKIVPSDEAEFHLTLCLTRPKITYNEDVLTENKGECSICLEDMCAGDRIARLPCLCIYHKQCIDNWFARKNCCPEHPGDD